MISIYKPNKSNTGFAFTFQIGFDKKSSEPVLYVGSIAQHSWDQSRRIGSFLENKKNPEKNINIKFNEFECGEIISAIKNRFEFNTFHAHGDNKTIIKLIPWDKPVKSSRQNPKTKEIEEYTITKPAFGFSLIRNGNQFFKIALEAGEAECVSVLLKELLNKIYLLRFDKAQAAIAKSFATKSDDPDF